MKRSHHDTVGTRELDCQVFDVTGTEHQTLCVFPLTHEQRDTVALLLIANSFPPATPERADGMVDAVTDSEEREGPRA